ncbi:MAG: thiamine-phosphate kinase [Thiohalomonadales bacterium]
MSESEFQIIQHYFKRNKYNSASIITGIGDDAAVLDISDQSNLVVSMDTLVSGVHFPDSTKPRDIAYKSLAVNLSDLAAMGATPAWFTLAITLPDNNSEWLTEFSSGLFELAELYKLDLVGGDTTQGPLSITIQIAGYVNNNSIMYRSGAKINDDIYVSGYIGDAGAGLLLLNETSILYKKDENYLITRLNRPTPRILLGEHIRKFSQSCVDISDGLLADLNHIINSSNCGAVVNVDLLPISRELKNASFEKDCFQLALDSGDDYELCFCVPEKYNTDIQNISIKLNIPITKIGKIVNDSGIKCNFENKPYIYHDYGYEHFKGK